MTWQPGEIYKTETKRFHLRSLTPEDITPAYVQWWNDPELQAGFGVKSRNWTRPQVIQNLQRFDNNNRFHFGVFSKESGVLVGFFTLVNDPKFKVSSANFLLGDKSLWGTGVLIEIKVHLMEFMFNTLGAVKLETKIHGRNLPSIYNSKAIGFKSEGILRKQNFGPDGTKIDTYLFGMTKNEWLELKKAGKGPYKK